MAKSALQMARPVCVAEADLVQVFSIQLHQCQQIAPGNPLYDPAPGTGDCIIRVLTVHGNVKRHHLHDEVARSYRQLVSQPMSTRRQQCLAQA